MRTWHVGEVDGIALLTDGDRIAALGPYAELAAAQPAAGPSAGQPAARVRRWAGRIDAGRCAADAPRLLERTYHPDPREAHALGTEPIDDEAALAALELTPGRWGESARRGVRRLLGEGVTAVAGPFTTEAARNAVRRAGLPVREPGHRPRLEVGAPAHFTVLTPEGHCLATALHARLLHRTR